MATITPIYAPSAGITITLASLANDAARQSTAVDNTVDLYDDVMVAVDVKLAAGTPGTDKAVYVYVYGSEDGTNFTDNATGTDGAITLRTPTNLRLAAIIATPDGGGLTYKSHPFSIAALFGGHMPRKWGIVVHNRTSVAFDATEGNHSKRYTGIKYNIS